MRVEQPASAIAQLRLEAIADIGQVAPEAWDGCANPVSLPHDSDEKLPYNPFVSHDFLSAIEESKSVGGRTGWQVHHLLVKAADGTLLAAAPCYLKSHSRGEYVFDRGWAEAYERAGGRYYPKLQVAVPFTPVAGPRLLVPAGPRAEALRRALTGGLIELCRHNEASGVHVTFAEEADYRHLGECGFLQRNDQQFHWHN